MLAFTYLVCYVLRYMNKKLGLIIIVLVLLLGGGAYVMMSKSKSAPVSPTTTEAKPTETTTTASQVKGTLKSLLTAGIPQSCTFTNDTGASGSVYVSGGKMRGDFQTTSQGKTFSGHMIIDSGYSYLWSDAMARGMKIAMSDVQPTGTAATNSQSMDVNQTVSYSCKPWVPDSSMFTLPANVTFTTFTMPKSMGTTGAMTPPSSAGAPANACSACDNLPAGPAQTACKTQLHCN